MTGTILRSNNDHFLIRGQKVKAIQERTFTISEVEEQEKGIVRFSLTSEEPYDRWFGTEILRHTKESVNLQRVSNGSAPILENHNPDFFLGNMLSAEVDEASKKLRCVAKFELDNPHDTRGAKVYHRVVNGMLKTVSGGYLYEELLFEERDGKDFAIATKWQLLEGSFVTVPADPTVGYGRSQNSDPENTPATQVEESPEKGETSKKNIETEERLTVADTPTIDKDKILKEERQRSESIYAAGRKYNCPELAEKAIADGVTLQEFRSNILDHQNKQSDQEPIGRTAIKPVGMSEKQRKNYSVLRAIGYAAGNISAKDAGLEIEVSNTLQERTGISPKGILIDQSELAAFRAPYDTATPAAAGDLIETELLSDRFIEQLYNQSAFLRMGVTYLRDLTGNIEIPREESFTNGYWVGEGQTIPEDEGTFDKIALSPKKLAVLSKVTYEMTEQSSIDLERLMRARLLRGLALELDRTIGFGNGIGDQPLGIVSHPETKSISLGSDGGALDWRSVISMQSELFANNAMGDPGYVHNYRTKAKLQTTLDHDTGSGNWIWQQNGNGMDGTIAGYRAYCSNQIPNNLIKGAATDLTAIFFGVFSEILLGLWSGMDVLTNPYSEFDKAIIQIRAMQLVDLQLTRGDYFCVATDVQNN